MNQFPFAAVVGLELAKKSLIYHAIDPKLGGTLFSGHRGCAKSTLVRGFAEILSLVRKQPVPFVELPLGTTEDRLLGSVHAEKLVQEGKWLGRAGLLEEANNGILYCDEINLLPDHLADLILDSAASSQHHLERDGISRHVLTRYLLIGTMNPEEGDLRPQLVDRFAHGVLIHDDFSIEERMQIVERRLRFDDEPALFCRELAGATQNLVDQIIQARLVHKDIEIEIALRRQIAEQAKSSKLEGIRAELAVLRTARCAAAWHGRQKVNEDDLSEAWTLCLSHRLPPDRKENNGASTSLPPEKSRMPTQLKHSSSPKEAWPDPLPLLPQKTCPHAQLQEWWQASSAKLALGADRSKGAKSTEGGAVISWIPTIIRAASQGWQPSQPGFKLVRKWTLHPRSLWCFIDASRSTGWNHFVSSSRDILSSFSEAPKRARFNLLLLDQHGPQWVARRASAGYFRDCLSQIKSASGKSPITASFKLLHQQLMRGRAAVGASIVICSDGIATSLPDETPKVARLKTKASLQKLKQLTSSIIWIHPLPKKGLSGWLRQICSQHKISQIEV